ncbi:MAG: carbon-nitrogen hydrolase family protein [Alphaproteobacteria bacterium]|nr:carbon-nitrogen hydrolase family protein [Alphaproteobacteria bacterium]
MDNLVIAIFQATAREEKPEYRLNWLDLAAERASGLGAQILICPELSLSGYRVADKLEKRAISVLGEYAQRVSEIATLHEIAIVYGYPEKADGVLYNTAAFVTAEGKMLGHHRKNHLPPGFERDMFARGKRLRVFTYLGWKIAMLIGYDLEFPEAARQAAMAGAELLIVPTVLDDGLTFVADKIVPVRALENGIYLAQANWSGQEHGVAYRGGSRIVAPDGEVICEAADTEIIIRAELQKSRLAETRDVMPYLQDRRKYDL